MTPRSPKKQVDKGWLGGPRLFTSESDPFVDSKDVKVGPAFGFGGQRGRELRAVVDRRLSSTDGAAAIHTTINLPLRGRVKQIAKLCRKIGERDL